MVCGCDLDHPMTLMNEPDLDILKMYKRTNNLGQEFQALEHYRHTDRQTKTQTCD